MYLYSYCIQYETDECPLLTEGPSMTPVLANLPAAGAPATLIVRLAPRPLAANDSSSGVAFEVREPQPIASLMPQVLARYGLNAASSGAVLRRRAPK